MSTVLLREVVDIDAPVERVWAYVLDWPRQQEWIPATRVHPVGDGTGVGAQVEARTGVGPFGFLDTMTVTAWDPPHRCEVLHTGRLVRGEGGFVVTPQGEAASQFEWWERFVVPAGPLGVAAWRLTRPAWVAGVRRSLRTLKRQAES